LGTGTYTAKFKAASCNKGEGIVSAFFTFWNSKSPDNSFGCPVNSEIDFEILGECPTKIHMSIWTHYGKNNVGYDCQRQASRSVDLSDGTISDRPSCDKNVSTDDKCDEPKKYVDRSKVIQDFNAAKNFYEYGFTWKNDYIRFFIVDKSGKEIELWKYEVKNRIPTQKGHLIFNLWHTNDWVCYDYEKTLKPPTNDAVYEIDWVKYEASS